MCATQVEGDDIHFWHFRPTAYLRPPVLPSDATFFQRELNSATVAKSAAGRAAGRTWREWAAERQRDVLVLRWWHGKHVTSAAQRQRDYEQLQCLARHSPH